VGLGWAVGSRPFWLAGLTGLAGPFGHGGVEGGLDGGLLAEMELGQPVVRACVSCQPWGEQGLGPPAPARTILSCHGRP